MRTQKPRGRIYPAPGTRAALVLDHIASNPGVTTNGIITALKMNPSPTRKILENLVRHGRAVDKPDDRGNHHYHARRSL